MTISKPIRTLADWKRLAPPKSRHHWVPGRSAQELARAWLALDMPPEVESLFRAHPDFGSVTQWSAEPEGKLRFDDYPGEPRNSDLVVDAVDRHGPYLIAVEGKADEPFGDTVAKTLAACRKRERAKRSNGVARVQGLAQWLLSSLAADAEALGSLRYQLLTATAGAIREAERRKCSRAVLLVHEFVTAKTAAKNLRRNADDLNLFVSQLSRGALASISTGQMVGPLLERTPNEARGVRFYIAKAVREA